MLRILTSGSRRFTDTVFVYEQIKAFIEPFWEWHEVVLIHGAEPSGTDACVQRIAEEWAVGCEVERHPADWKSEGLSAGPKRNSKMVALGAHVLLAFPCPKSRGTVDCINKAWRAGIPVRIFPVFMPKPGLLP